MYLDNIIVAPKTFEDHVKILTGVLRLLKSVGINLSKCRLAYKEGVYLGYRVNKSGISPNEAHLQAIKNYPVPKNTKEVKQCMGSFSYF